MELNLLPEKGYHFSLGLCYFQYHLALQTDIADTIGGTMRKKKGKLILKAKKKLTDLANELAVSPHPRKRNP